MTERGQEGAFWGGRNMDLDLVGGYTVNMQRSAELDIQDLCPSLHVCVYTSITIQIPIPGSL